MFGTNNTPFVGQPQQQSKQNLQTGGQFQKQYNEDLYRIAGFSFPFNNLFLVCLMKRSPRNGEDDRELFFGFATCVLGVGSNQNRTYDFSQKIVQKFSLKDLQSLSFALKQLAVGNKSILPFSKFTNSGSGSKSLYLNFHEQDQNAQQNGGRPRMEKITLGFSHNNLKINIPLSQPDAYSIADVIEQLYKTGINMEITEQIQRNANKTNLSGDINNGCGVSPVVESTSGFNTPRSLSQPPIQTPPIGNMIPNSNPHTQIPVPGTGNVSPTASKQIDAFGTKFWNLAAGQQTP